MTGLRRHASEIKHRLLRTDAQLSEQYLRSAASPKLHIGGGPRRLEGWLNTDLLRSSGVMAMDATRPFPFPDATFDYVYSEHMIEHVSYPDGTRMLGECRRVLKPGGVLRLVTPDLRALLALAGDDLSDLQRRYLDYFCRTFLPSEVPGGVVSALNAHFREWGHTYVYDEETLREAVAGAGFVDIQRFSLRDSPHAALADLANDDRYPPGLLDYESVALEGRKPA